MGLMGKNLGKGLLIMVIIASVIMAVMITMFNMPKNTTDILVSTIGGAGFIALLNLMGLGFGSKYFGGFGILISGVILAYGIAVLLTNSAIFTSVGGTDPNIIGGVAIGIGGGGLLTSVRILTL